MKSALKSHFNNGRKNGETRRCFPNGELGREVSFYEEYEIFYKNEWNISVEDFAIKMKINWTIPGYVSPFEIVATYLICSFIFIMGTISDVITCMVIVKNSAMRNVTNYYLLSLAVSDIIISACGKYAIITLSYF